MQLSSTSKRPYGATPAAFPRVPAQIQSVIQTMRPFEMSSVSHSTATRRRNEWDRACAPAARPQYSTVHKQLLCPNHPLLPVLELSREGTAGFPCCLPTVIQTEEDMRRIWHAANKLGILTTKVIVETLFTKESILTKRTQYNLRDERNWVMANDRKLSSGAVDKRVFDELVWTPFTKGILEELSLREEKAGVPSVIYRRDPETNQLQSSSPTSAADEMIWLIASDHPDAEVQKQIRDLVKNLHSKTVAKQLLAYTNSPNGRPELARWLQDQLDKYDLL